MNTTLREAFDLENTGELIAFVGGGGKTSLLFALGEELAAGGKRVILTTTTRIAAYEAAQAPAIWRPDTVQRSNASAAALGTLLAQNGLVLVAGGDMGDKVKGVSLDLPGRLLARSDVDFVLVEADGANQLPIKAPAGHEPALPIGLTLLVPVVGIDALEAPLAQVAHRPKLIKLLTRRRLPERLSPVDVAVLLTHPEGGLKGLPEGARVVPFLNKVETDAQAAAAAEIAFLVLRNPHIARVVSGAVRRQPPVREVFS